MAERTDAPTSAEAGVIVIERIFDAPRELVWKAWTEPDHVMRWWGPQGFTCPLARLDFREGGRSLVCMRAPTEFGGQDMYSTWTYTKIVPSRRSSTCTTLPTRTATGSSRLRKVCLRT